MLWMAPPTKDFHLIVFNIVAFNGIILSMTSGMAHDLCRKYVSISKLFIAVMGQQ